MIQDESLQIEKYSVINALLISLCLVAFVWLAFLLNSIYDLNWNDYGLHPRNDVGLLGILTMPFLHADFKHLLSNSLPLLCLLFAIIYFFKQTALQILLLVFFFTGLLTWIIAKDGNHIGASGIVYALAFFLTTISILKKETRLMAYTLIIVFLYGTIIWGFFPSLFPERHISWQGHLSGAITGTILAFLFRTKGPNKKIYFEDEDGDNNEDDT